MYLAIKCETFGEYGSDDDVQACILNLDKELVGKIRKMEAAVISLNKELDDLATISVFEYSPGFYTTVFFDRLLTGEETFLVVTEKEFNEIKVECENDRAQVNYVELFVDKTHNGRTRFQWKGVVKHSDISFETKEMFLEDFSV